MLFTGAHCATSAVCRLFFWLVTKGFGIWADVLRQCEPLISSSKSAMEMLLQLYMIILMTAAFIFPSPLPPPLSFHLSLSRFHVLASPLSSLALLLSSTSPRSEHYYLCLWSSHYSSLSINNPVFTQSTEEH